MSKMRERLPRLIEIHEEDLPDLLAKQRIPSEDAEGFRSISISDRNRDIGVAKYVLCHDVAEFKGRLREATWLQLQLFMRHEAGEPIHPDWLSLLVYKSIFDALAIGAFDLATDLAHRMGSQPEVEKKRNHPFDYALGYALKWFVLGDRDRMEAWCGKVETEFERTGNKNFRGYATVMRAIVTRDQQAANGGLQQIVDGHVKECRRGVFRDSIDEVLCVWGLGAANLCRHYGLIVDAVPPLIPGDLLA